MRAKMLFCLAVLAGGAAAAPAPVSLIRNGGFATGLDPWATVGGKRLKATAVPAEVGTWRHAARLVSTVPAGSLPWSAQLSQRTNSAVRKGDHLYFRAWLRSPDKCPVVFCLEQTAAPHAKVLYQRVVPTTGWQEYKFLARARQAYGVANLAVRFFVGSEAGTVEVTGVRVDNYGEAIGMKFEQTVDYWGGRDHDDTWKPAALARIEQIRKGDLTVKVVDAAGQPVPSPRVKVTQLRHHFRFGTCVPAGRLVDTKDANNLRLQRELVRLYNTVTFENDLKWAAASEATLARVDQAAAWLKAHDLELRGHCLVWGSYGHLPKTAKDLRGAALLAAVEAHVKQYANRYRGRLYLWDVVNEAVTNTALWQEVGWENFAKVYQWVREADPQVRLAYNDFAMTNVEEGHRKKVAERVQYLIDHGAPLDVIGMQEHHGTPLVPLDQVLKNVEYWAKFGRDLEVTEFDLGVQDDTVHGQWCRDHLIAMFSQPKVTAYIYWGCWEGSHWRAKDGAAMFRLDWSKRPAQLAYEELVLKQWWTRSNELAGADGVLKTRAFYGRHRIEVDKGDQKTATTCELTPGGAGEVTVKLP